jgi:hypothetical protein
VHVVTTAMKRSVSLFRPMPYYEWRNKMTCVSISSYDLQSCFLIIDGDTITIWTTRVSLTYCTVLPLFVFLVGADHATHNLDTENNNLTEANYYLSIRYSIKKIDDDDCWKKRNIRLHRIFYPD